MRPPQSRTLLEVAERLLVRAEILVFLGEREAQLHLSAPVRRAPLKPGFQLGDVIALGGLRAQVCAILERFVIVGLERDDPIVVGLRLLERTDEPPYGRTVEKETRVVGIEVDGPIVRLERSLLVVCPGVDRAERIEEARIGRCPALCRAGRFPRAAQLADREQALRAEEQELRVFGLEGERAIDSAECFERAGRRRRGLAREPPAGCERRVLCVEKGRR
jgi:hypothetical protein